MKNQTKAVRFFSMSTDQSLKVILLGNSGCGKTAIITRWISDIFDENRKSTLGCNHQRKEVILDNIGTIDLCVWDTAGQERFRSLIPLYARSSSLAIITTAIDDEASFEAVPGWIEVLSSAEEITPPVILAVNKMDLVATKRPVMREDEIRARFDPTFIQIFFVSALTGDHIDHLFCAAAVEASQFALGHQGRESGSVPEVEVGGAACC
jgi:small GTP-binding protein